MALGQQILWGSVFLALCLVIQVILMAVCYEVLHRMRGDRPGRHGFGRVIWVILVTSIILVLAHTIQVWIWSCVWIYTALLPDWNVAVYFTLVTYSTVGYGDVVLGPGARVFAAFASFTGLFAFGLSTAFLVAVVNGLLGIDKAGKDGKSV